MAGLIAAETDNDLGVASVAPQARLASWVIFGTSFRGQESIASDEQLMDMFQYASNRVAVQNHSWGSTTTTPLAMDALSNEGVGNAVVHGREGKGVVIVRAAGNYREDLINANDDGFANDPRVITVGAVRKDGRATSYTSPGACLLLGAPSGDLLDTDGDGQNDAADPTAPDVLTTDRSGTAGYNTAVGEDGNYTFFNGTSASAPQVAGVAALILSANPALTYRDVQQILIFSARHFDLADPGLHRNGAGFWFSHNDGYGVPDAGVAVRYATVWSNRPPAKTVSITNTVRQNIPDDALRVVCAGTDLPPTLASIRCLPALGPHPDEPTSALPLVYVGQANDDITLDLHGKAALIQRGQSYFSEKIDRAARAGAAFAIIFNNQGTNQIQAMGGTTFCPIPSVSIGLTDGEALRDYLAVHPDTTAKIQLTPAVYRLRVSETLSCEHVGVRLKTTHSQRADVRVTLVSPMGTRSILQAINGDTTRGPTDWTYWSTQHFYESSAGEWRLEVSDERATTVRTFPSGTTAATGAVTYAELIIKGVGITDSDADGLDDTWEMQWFGNLNSGPTDDPDRDGHNNAREQVLGTDPNRSISPPSLAASLLLGGLLLTWLIDPSPARAVLFYSTADPNYNTTAPAGALSDSGWDLQGLWGIFLGTPVAPRYFLTARHIGGTVGDPFLFQGASYVTTAFFDDTRVSAHMAWIQSVISRPIVEGPVTLQSSPTPAGSYSENLQAQVDAVAGIVTIPIPADTRFYRLSASTPTVITRVTVRGSSLVLSFSLSSAGLADAYRSISRVSGQVDRRLK